VRAIVVLYVVLSAWLLAMPAGIEAQLRKSGLNSQDVSIYIKETGSNGNIVATHRESQSRVPASVIKVMTTYASVLKLGFDYRFPTQFYRSGLCETVYLRVIWSSKGLVIRPSGMMIWVT